MGPLRFWLNDREQALEGISPTTTLLRYLREHAALPGTKEGCAEGDCGACTVTVLEPTANGDRGTFRAINACMVLLPMLQGKQVYTVEGIQTGAQPHPVQQALADRLGSQCGYCTPGVVMSLFEACYRDDLRAASAPWVIDAQMCGNLCRCTGYRPIRDTAQAVAGARPDDRFRAQCDAKGPDVALAAVHYTARGQRYFAPATLEELFHLWDEHPDARVVMGGTDLGLEVTKRYAKPSALLSLEALVELKGLSGEGPRFSIGAGAFLSDVEAFSEPWLPPLGRMLRYFGSRQVKNRATVGGNLCNASPIGDLPPLFLALDADVVLRSREGERVLPLDQFFVGYRKTALRPKELLARVEFPRPGARTRVSAYKVSKRRELDISTVAAAFAVTVDAGNTVRSARLAYGGMAATPSRARFTEATLLGKPWNEASLEPAVQALGQDFKPISDHRGSAEYRLRLAENLLRGFFEETKDTPMPPLRHPHTSTLDLDER